MTLDPEFRNGKLDELEQLVINLIFTAIFKEIKAVVKDGPTAQSTQRDEWTMLLGYHDVAIEVVAQALFYLSSLPAAVFPTSSLYIDADKLARRVRDALQGNSF